MCCAFYGPAKNAADPRLDESVRRAIAKLISLHNGDIGVIETVACGSRAISPLRALLFAREPSGLYESRRRAVEALSLLHADEVLIDFLATPRHITDPVEKTGEDAVTNAVARALVNSSDPRVLPLLLSFTARAPLAGVIEALGKRRCIVALPYFISALAEDFTRPAAEAALRELGPPARAPLLKTAVQRTPPAIRETASSKRQRRSALGLVIELGTFTTEEWPILRDLMRDSVIEIAALACETCLQDGNEPTKVTAVVRLVDLLSAADWPLTEEIEGSLVKHFSIAKQIVEGVLRHDGMRIDLDPRKERTLRALRWVALHATSNPTKS